MSIHAGRSTSIEEARLRGATGGPRLKFGDERLPARFWDKVAVNMDGGCWEWRASRYPNGYGGYTVGQRRKRVAHRVAYEVLVGDVPAGLELDHLCRVRHCVNPAHLEPVSHSENQLRGAGPAKRSAFFASITHCKHGHEYTTATTYRDKYGKRRCRTCQRAAVARYAARMRAR